MLQRFLISAIIAVASGSLFVGASLRWVDWPRNEFAGIGLGALLPLGCGWFVFAFATVNNGLERLDTRLDQAIEETLHP
jgi:hypothetical protein